MEKCLFEYNLNTPLTMAFSRSTYGNCLSALARNSMYKEQKSLKDKTQCSELNLVNVLGVNLATKNVI